MVEGDGMMETLVDAIQSLGFSPPRHIIWDGKIHRWPTSPEKPHSKDGWYVAHDDDKGKAAGFGSMRDQVKHTWAEKSDRKFTPADLAALDDQREAAKKKAIAARNATAIRAQRIYAQASESGHSDYIGKKKISVPDGCKFVSLMDAAAFGFKTEKPWHITGMIVPMQNAEGKIVNLQILANGVDKKLFMPESTTQGAFHIIGGEVKDRVVIAEGIATAQAIAPRSKCPVVVAFSASNLPSVARIFRHKYPNAEIILAADGDPAGRDYSAKAVSGLPGKSRVIEAPEGKDFWDAQFPELEQNLSYSELMDKLVKKTQEDGSQGKILPRVCNYRDILLFGEGFPDLAYNDFSEMPMIDGAPMDEDGITDILTIMESKWVPDKVARNDIEAAARRVAKHHRYHPVMDYLHSTRWDGIDRIDNFFADHLESEKSEYLTGVARALFIGAVRRILYPGCKLDTMVVLESPQGVGKSSLWQALAGEWYLDQTASIESVDFFIAMKGKWFIDLGELDQFQRAEITRIKQVITLQDDDYRAKYARDNERHPRQSVFVGGTNGSDWIADQTGGRRFLPVVAPCKKIDIPRLLAVRDQLFAEAMHRVRNHEWPDWWNVPGAEEQQELRMQYDLWDAPVSEFLDRWARDTIQGHEILVQLMKKDLGQITRSDEIKIGKVMNRLKWERKKMRKGSITYWCYSRPPS